MVIQRSINRKAAVTKSMKGGRADELNHLLLNVLIIWACIFLYQVLWLDRPNHNEKLDKPIFTGLLVFGMLALMSFPIGYFPDYPFQLSGVLVLVGSLYGGMRVGLVLSVTIVLVRIAQGFSDIGVIAGIIFSLWVLIAVLLRYYPALSVKNKLLAGTLFAAGDGMIIIGSVYTFKLNQPIGWDFHSLSYIAAFGLLHAASAYMSIYFIEKMRENAVMQAEIQQREKMQMLGELAASVAHEIRNPMTVVRGFMQLMNGHDSSLKRFNEYSPLIIEELDRAESILSDYLSFAKPQEHAWEQLELIQQLTQVVHMVAPFANMHQVEIRTCWQTSLTIYFDRKKLRQLMVNLMKNAIEAMPEGGSLDVELYREKEQAVIRLIDTGIGMSEEELKRLGSLFYSTKTKGTGIGIMICYKIVEAAGGTLQLNSRKDKGTTVTIRMPLLAENVMEETR
ncbi:ATP-binding protein [Paenibacillus sp. NPDC056579]|uniref:ATP-binding protein n=1 Tax=unclassified Paenibacillus TaxID=185978 RepID=UPI001EF92BD0|nr:ATP-binding protein [Paenibacillus sp. H1-7]